MRTRTSNILIASFPANCMLLALLLFSSVAAAQAQSMNQKPLSDIEEEKLAKSIFLAGEKAAVCNDILCIGKYSELINNIHTFSSGTVRLEVTQMVIDAISQSSTAACTLVVGGEIPVTPDGDGGEEEILTQLYLSAVLDSEIWLRWIPDSSGSCALGYIRAVLQGS